MVRDSTEPEARTAPELQISHESSLLNISSYCKREVFAAERFTDKIERCTFN